MLKTLLSVCALKDFDHSNTSQESFHTSSLSQTLKLQDTLLDTSKDSTVYFIGVLNQNI